MRAGLVAGVVLPISFYFGSHWGIVGTAAVWVTVRPLVILPLYWRLFKRIELSTMAYLKALWPALSGGLLLVMAVWTVKQTVPPAWPLPVSFSLQVLAGGAAYTLAAVTLHRGRLRLFYHTLRMARRSAL